MSEVRAGFPTYWVAEELNTSKQSSINSFRYLNRPYAIDFQNLYKLTDALLDPNFMQVINNWFSNPSDFIGELYCFPFPIPVDGAKRDLLIAGRQQMGRLPGAQVETESVQAYAVDAHNLAKKLRLLFSRKIEPYGETPEFFDYNGYMTIQVYLPYYGYVEVSPNDLMGQYLCVYCAFSFTSGEVIYFVCTSDIEQYNVSIDTSRSRILSKITTKFASQIPLGSSNALEVRRNILMSAVKTTASLAASAVTGVPIVGTSQKTSTSETSTVKEYDVYGRGSYKGARMKQTKAGTETTTSTTTHTSPEINHTHETMQEIVGASTNALAHAFIRGSTENSKEPILEQWATSAVKVVIQRPVFPDMGDYAHFYGRPLGAVRLIGDMTGFTKVADAHLEMKQNMTLSEYNEILSLLMSGVIIQST